MRRLIYNSDGTNVFMREEPTTAGGLDDRVDEVARGGVTTFLICPNAGQNFYYRGGIGECIADRADDPRENVGTLKRIARNVRELIDAGIDPIEHILRRSRARGIEAFVTFRTNELHDVDRPGSALISEFYEAHPDWRVNEPDRGWFGLAPDFSRAEVRERRFAEIADIIDRHDIDGIELDFQRFPSYFPSGKGDEGVPIMNAFVDRVRAKLDGAGSRRGRRILLAARVPTTLDGCRRIGLDPAAWHRTGRLDFLTIAPFLRTLFAMPIAEFRAAMPGLPIYAGIEHLATYAKGKGRWLSRELMRGAAASLLAAGADGISIFNMFCTREYGEESWEPPFAVLDEIGGADMLAELPKVYIVDRRSDYDQAPDVVPILPRAFAEGETVAFPIAVLARDSAASVAIRVAVAPGDEAPEVAINGVTVRSLGRATSRRAFPEPHDATEPGEAQVWVAPVPPGALCGGTNTICVTARTAASVEEIEIAVMQANRG